MRRTCERVQARLPLVVDGTYPERRGRLLLRHVARCGDCAAELDRQRQVAGALTELGARDPGRDEPPPDELLDSILERVNDPGMRARAAGPARGAVSGARPELSAAAVLLTVAVVYLAWRLARAVAERLNRDG